MHTFAHARKLIRQTKPVDPAAPSKALSVQNHKTCSDLGSKCAIEDHATTQAPRSNDNRFGLDVPQDTEEHVEYDFIQVPLLAKGRDEIRSKLKISAPGDIREQEADRLVDEVLEMPETKNYRVCSCSGNGINHREQEPKIGPTRMTFGSNIRLSTIDDAAPSIVHEAVSASGQQLSPITRASMEARFGFDFGRVRIHTEDKAASAAKTISAKAFTIGRHIAFDRGEFSPQSSFGERLLAHELSHVMQQGHATQGASDSRIVYRYPADHPYHETVSYDRIDRRGGIHWGIVIHIPREINGAPLDLQTAIACVQAALRMDVQRERVSRLTDISETLQHAVEETLDRQRSQDIINVVVRYTREPERGNRVSDLQVEHSGPVPVQEPETEQVPEHPGPVPVETEEAPEEPERVESCPSWIPVNNDYVYARIIEILTQNNGDTDLAFSQSREERNRAPNCCDLNYAAIEHYFMFRSDVGGGQTGAGRAHAESIVGGIVRPYTGLFRTGACPVSPLSTDVVAWERYGIQDGQRDLETTPPPGRGVSVDELSDSEFLEVRLRNTTRPPTTLEEIYRESQM